MTGKGDASLLWCAGFLVTILAGIWTSTTLWRVVATIMAAMVIGMLVLTMTALDESDAIIRKLRGKR